MTEPKAARVPSLMLSSARSSSVEEVASLGIWSRRLSVRILRSHSVLWGREVEGGRW